MKKLNSVSELKSAVQGFKPILYLRENHTQEIPDKRDILVCGGTGCTSSNSLEMSFFHHHFKYTFNLILF